MGQPQAKKGCGCGNRTTAIFGPSLEKQKKMAEIVQKINKRKNSVYKTRTPYFM